MISRAIRKVWYVGGWVPLLVFGTHVFLSRVLDAYKIWPPTDIPMHFMGGLAMAFFISKCFQTLPRGEVRKSRTDILELVLVGSLTATAAVLWEFAEFSVDQFFGTNIQVSLANTIQDMALGLGGASLFIVFRARQLRTGRAEITELALDWIEFRKPRLSGPIASKSANGTD